MTPATHETASPPATTEFADLLASPAQRRLDALHGAWAQLPAAPLHYTHRFTPGLYLRQLDLLKNTWVISQIHRTEHPLILLAWEISVWTEETGVKRLRAPQILITKPGTRRAIFHHTDTTVLTCHATDKTDPQAIEQEICYDHQPGRVVPELDPNIIQELTL